MFLPRRIDACVRASRSPIPGPAFEEHDMYAIDTAAGQVVANDTQKSVDAVDSAVMSFAHLCASIVEVSKASNLPIGTAQSALHNAANGLTKLVSSREDMSQATRELIGIQRASSLEATSFGCPNGFPRPQGHQADVSVTADRMV